MQLSLDEAHTFYIFFYFDTRFSLADYKLVCGSAWSAKSGTTSTTYTKKHWRKDGARLFHRDLKELRKTGSIDPRESHQIVMATESPISFVSLHQLSFWYIHPFCVYVIARLGVCCLPTITYMILLIYIIGNINIIKLTLYLVFSLRCILRLKIEIPPVKACTWLWDT